MAQIPPGMDQTPMVMGVAWSFTTASTAFVGMRYFCRINYHQKLSWDDAWMGITLFFSWAMSITWSIYAHNGGTQYALLPPAREVAIQRILWISQAWCISGLAFGKVAIAALILRLQAPSKTRTRILWALCAVTLAWNASQVILIFTQCRPTAKLWDQAGYPDGSCLDPWVFVGNAIASCSYMAALDLALAAIPVHMIWPLQMPMKKKLGICCLLSTGIVASAMAIVKTSMLPADLSRSSDLVHTTGLLIVWNAIEVNVVILAGCVPTLVPIFDVLRGRRPTRGDEDTSRPSESVLRARERFLGRRRYRNMYSVTEKTAAGNETILANQAEAGLGRGRDDTSSGANPSWECSVGAETSAVGLTDGIHVTRDIRVT